MKKPTKAIIAAAGFGTRFLPQTKAMPKEMLPLIDKPIIQYVVEELVEAGIKDIIIISNANKRAIDAENPESPLSATDPTDRPEREEPRAIETPAAENAPTSGPASVGHHQPGRPVPE